MPRGPEMNASHFDGYSRKPLRIGLTVVAGLAFFGESLSTFMQVKDEYFRPRDALLLNLLPPSAPLFAAVYLAMGAGLVAFARGRHALPGGLVALASMAPINQWGLEVTGSISNNFYFPASMMFGWCAGLMYARWLTRRGFDETVRGPDESLAEAGAVGVLAALYVGSGVSKLLANGLGWANPHGLRAVLLSQQGILDTNWIDAYRALIINNPAVSMSMSVAALVIELGAFALLINRPIRTIWSLLILGLHANILLLAGIPYMEPILLVPLFGLPWPRLFRMRRTEPALEPGPSPATPPIPRRFVIGAVILALLSLLLVDQKRGHGHRSNEEPQHHHNGPADRESGPPA